MIVPVVDWIGSGLSAHLLWVVFVFSLCNEFFHLYQKGIKTHENRFNKVNTRGNFLFKLFEYIQF
jgi:hypothetical protein